MSILFVCDESGCQVVKAPKDAKGFTAYLRDDALWHRCFRCQQKENRRLSRQTVPPNDAKKERPVHQVVLDFNRSQEGNELDK